MAMVISRKYEVVGQLGQGGMGLVYKVRHTTLQNILALKVLPADLMDDEEMLARFYREARVMAHLSHPHIVRVMDIDRDDNMNLHYFVMEYIEGITLGQYIKNKGGLTPPEIIDISRQVAGALSYAHNHNPPIIHRDIKPANIMIEDRTSRMVVMDFGIAKELGSGNSTSSGVVIGTLKYASPEQLRHEPLDGRADVYSLGMVMYEMYTGKQFFAGLDEPTVLGKVLSDQNENEPHFDGATNLALAAIIRKAIAKFREQRYRTMEELLRALDLCAQATAKKAQPTETEPAHGEAQSTETVDLVLRIVECVDPSQIGRKVVLTHFPFSVGRGSNSDLTITGDTGLSRRHVVLD
ncbi:MAG: protein kinase, partial [Candidatus Binatia bacterium]